MNWNQLLARLARLPSKANRVRLETAVRRRSKLSHETLEERNLLTTISWTSGDITGDESVSLNGTSVFAISGSASTGSTTINGVNFLHSRRSDAASLAQEQSPGGESLSTTLRNDNNASFGTGGLGAVGQIITGGWWGTSTENTATVTLTGLTIGDLYEVQIFANDARGTRDDGFITTLDNGAGGIGIDLELNNTPRGGSAGDYGIGTFTADTVTQSFELSGFLNGEANPGRIQVNAIQLRKLQPVVLLPGSYPLVNEFSASNTIAIDDDNGNSSDWIEIYNAGEDAIDLAGYLLTDDPTDTSKYVFPSTTLLGGQYLIVFAGDDIDPTTGSDLYTGFGLSSSGEYLGFFDPAGDVISEFGAGGTNYPSQITDVSYGLLSDGNYDTSSFFATPTPGRANANPVDGVIDELPTVSVERGFYEQAFDVEIASQTPGATIVYTTDGTEPSLTNGTQVAPDNANSLVKFTLPISETTSLRTTAVRQGYFSRNATTTHTYVFIDDVISSSVMDTGITQDSRYEDLMRDALLDIPTLSFNYETVIVNSDVPEQRASIEWLAPDGSEGFQIDAGIKGFGGYFTNFAKKNFRVNFRSEYGESKLDFPLFEGFDNGIAAATEGFDSLDFRSGSHDMVARGFYMSNRFVDDTLMDAGHAVPHGRFVHIYTNGVYWGQYHMRERWDADFLSQYYGGNNDDYEAVNGNVNNGNSTPNGWSPGEVYDGEGTAWSNINRLADTDGSGNPTGGYQELKDVVNLEQYIDYMLVYMAGRSENEYRAGGTSDGSVPYTFTLNDADGWLRGTDNKTGNAGPGNILGTLLDEGDPEFMTLYSDRIHNMFGADGVLSEDRSVERLQERLEEVQLSFIAESARWGYRTPSSWQSAANSALNNMLPDVANSMTSNLRARGDYPFFDAPSFAIEGEFQNGGAIESGDLLTLDATELIYYTTDGTDPRLEGGGINPNAIAYDASTTTSTIFSYGSDWKYLDDGSNQGTDWRSPTFDDSSWASGVSELGYGDDPATTVSFGDDPDDKHITTYFRKAFEVTESFDTATLDLFYDDGAVVYLNGEEVARVNMNGTVNWQTLASGTVGNGTASVFDITSSLAVGTNTLAVEIHQRASDSSDISFNAGLSISSLIDETESIPLTTSTNVQARAFSNGEWSAVRNATFVVPASQIAPQSELRITELSYNPVESAAGADDGDDFEFIEIFNSSTTGTINLAGVELSDGVEYEFLDVDLAPGERVVIVEDEDAFRDRHGNSATVLGEWSGGLSAGGEEITLTDSAGDEIMSVNYGDNDPWYGATDGQGFTLVLNDPANTPSEELGKYYSWRASTEFNGTPGTAAAHPIGVVINEVLAHTDLPQSDSIELFNPTDSVIDIGGWYLSDDTDDLLKYQIAPGTLIASAGYLVFDESDFNTGLDGFALSSDGDTVYLSQASGGTFIGLQDSVEFGATFNGESLGRLPNGTGRLTRLESTSPGGTNEIHKVGELVISEVNYHPSDPSSAALLIEPLLTDNDLEFIEIANPTDSAIDLTDWRLRGEADFDFAPGTSLAAGERLAVLAFDPNDLANASKLAAFMAHYDIGSSATLVGGLSGSLSNSSGRISLQKPDAPNLLEIPRVVVDQVVYDDLAPFADADGNGFSLSRLTEDTYGNDALSWIGQVSTPATTIDVPGDANRDGSVSFADFLILSSNFGKLADAVWADGDFNADGQVSFADFLILSGNFGTS